MEIRVLETGLEPETGAGSGGHKVIGVLPAPLLLTAAGLFNKCPDFLKLFFSLVLKPL